MRLDQFLVDRGDFASRARAQEAVVAGLVRIDGEIARKPAQKVLPGARIDVSGAAHPFVSRGGLKLAGALDRFGIDPSGMVCLDLGASTGGFTDVLLRRGAKRIYAVDVGTGQLHQSLAGDPRVANMERTHARNLTRAAVPDEIDLVVCDVSFISLRKALPPAMALCGGSASAVALIKPQFELGPEKIGRGGRVKASDKELNALIGEIADWFDAQGWRVLGLMESPIAGGEGAQEFLIAATR